MGSYVFTVGFIAGFYGLLSLGLNITTGFAGQVSIGHAAFMAVGAYTTAILGTQLGWAPIASISAAVVVSALVGMLLGLPSLRLRGDFLVIVTLGMGLVVQSLAQYLPITGGALGIGNIPRLSFRSAPLGPQGYFVVVWALVLAGIVAARALERSWFGLGLRALRDDEIAAEMLGWNVPRLKILAFATGAAYAGLAGALFAHFMMFISPEMFGLSESIVILSMIVVGGLGSVWGAVLGAVLLGTAPETLRWAADYRMTIHGLLLLTVIRFFPSGLLGWRVPPVATPRRGSG